jgi:hypothetical protein
MQREDSDWRTILLVLGAGGGALLAFAAVAAMLGYIVLGSTRPDALPGDAASPLDIVVLSSAVAFIGLVMLPSVYYGIQRLRGKAIGVARFGALKIWMGLLLILLWLAAAKGAGVLVNQPTGKWVTPLLYVVAIGIPVYFFARLAAGGVAAGSRQRLWGALAAGIGLGIAPAMIAELAVAFLGVVGVAIYVGLHPDRLQVLQQLIRQLQDAHDLEQVMNVVAPWLQSPLALLTALLFFSGISPMIEETAKSLATWTVFDRLASPAQGFVVGAMSGAAFGLVESLLVSATPDTNWTTTLLVRGASTMMHIMAASLTGWGIGQFRATRSFSRLLAMCVAAMCLHGLWNASVVAISFGSLRSVSGSSSPDPIGMVFIVAGAAVLVMLCLGIPVGMAVANWHFRREASPSIAPAAAAAQQTPEMPASEVPWALESEPTSAEEETAPHSVSGTEHNPPPT